MIDGKRAHMSRRALLVAGGSATLFAPSLRAQARSGWSDLRSQAASLDQLHTIVVWINGEEVFADRFRGPGLDRAVNVKSVSKTFVAALTGAAIDRDILPGLDATIGGLSPGLIPTGADPRVAGITLGDLITMQAGLERTSGQNYGAWVSSPNWVAHALSRPMVSEPGRGMSYSTGSFHILGAVLTEVSGRSLHSLARDWLGNPLGIEIAAWTRDPQGYYLGGNEMSLSPRAMIRFAEMYRQGGVWSGSQVLSANWVESSFEPRTRSRFSGLDYGLGWFLGRIQGYEFALGRGYGGQLVGIVPELRMSFAITSDPTRPARSGGYFGDLLDLIGQGVIPAARTV
ncbi:MAG: serine hydrolase [Pseudomonadota bacterium]